MERDQAYFYKSIDAVLCCPVCQGALVRHTSGFECGHGHGPFREENEKKFFIETETGDRYHKEHESGINRLKSFFKRSPALYYFLWNIFCPVWVSRRGLKHFCAMLPENAIVLNLGSGPRRIRKSWVNIDVVPFDLVDIVATADQLPFQNNSVDAVVSESLFEHLADPAAVEREISRVLKPGGILYVSTPFLTPYHASPDDYNRWTLSGLRQLFSDFEMVKEGVDAGPWSALLVFLAYWLGVVFSFGNRKLAATLAFIFMIPLGPFKIFDFFFARLPGAEIAAAQLYCIGRKK